MSLHQGLSPTVIEQLIARLSPGAVRDQPEELAACAGDASTLRATPALVVRPNNIADIQLLFEFANRYGFPISPRGGGSGLAGGCLAEQGGVALSLLGLNRIRKVDRENFLMEVEAGVISQEVRAAAAAAGLFYPPDPAGMDLSTIGGNAATDAGGPSCVKYGTTRDYILGLEAVLPSGEILHTGVRTRKGVVGYDLTNLLVGSEGTLAVITALILKLLPKPAARRTLLCALPDMVSAMRAVNRVLEGGPTPAAIEFLDQRCLGLIGELLPFPLPSEARSLLLIEVDGALNRVDEDMQAVRALLAQTTICGLFRAEDAAQRRRLWELRRQVSLRIHDYAALYLSEDVTVPLSAIAELVDALPEFERDYGLEIFAFGHAGDGNIHLNITTQDLSREQEAHQGARALLALVLALGGTISGEHGIGLAKKQYLDMELAPHNIELQRRIKALFDPNLILNPSKIFP